MHRGRYRKSLQHPRCFRERYAAGKKLVNEYINYRYRNRVRYLVTGAKTRFSALCTAFVPKSARLDLDDAEVVFYRDSFRACRAKANYLVMIRKNESHGPQAFILWNKVFLLIYEADMLSPHFPGHKPSKGPTVLRYPPREILDWKGTAKSPLPDLFSFSSFSFNRRSYSKCLRL